MTNWVLGIGASHNGGACVLRDGEVVVAVQEERLTRVKRTRLYPAFDQLSLAYCLEHCGISVEDLVLVAVTCVEPVSRPEFDITRNPLFHDRVLPDVAYVAHHRAHAAAACCQSGFRDAAVLIIDGMGSPYEDFPEDERAVAGRNGWETMSIYELSRGRLVKCLQKEVAAHGAWMSPGDRGMPRFGGIGGMYSAVAQQVFGQPLEAGKVMGLAPYGRTTIGCDEFLTIEESRIAFVDRVPQRFPFDDRWPEHERDYANLAASVQAALEEAVLWCARRARTLTRASRLVFAGGVALNCIANERIIREAGFDEVFIMPAAEDSGTSVGAAVEASLERNLPVKTLALRRDESGRPYRRHEVTAATRLCPFVVHPTADQTHSEIAAALASGARVAWFAGGSELGPRALGQRSILADPRHAALKHELNQKKGREAFRPLAPIVLSEHADEWFDMGKNPESPYMMRVCAVRDHRQATIPAVVHVDGTARVQTLDAASNPSLHATLAAFFELTGVPVLVNTSLNAAGEPIAETPEDALWCAYRLGLELAVIDGLVAPIAEQIDRDVEIKVQQHEIRRWLGSDRRGAEVEVITPWGPTRHWLEGSELSLLQQLADRPTITIGEFSDEHQGAVLEALRRKRLVALQAAATSRTS